MSVKAIRTLKPANNHGTMRIVHRGDTFMGLGELKPTVTVITDGVTYRFTTRKSGHYRCQKIDGLKIRITYEPNTFHETCDCDGFRSGFRCKHLLMVEKLEQLGELN